MSSFSSWRRILNHQPDGVAYSRDIDDIGEEPEEYADPVEYAVKSWAALMWEGVWGVGLSGGHLEREITARILKVQAQIREYARSIPVDGWSLVDTTSRAPFVHVDRLFREEHTVNVTGYVSHALLLASHVPCATYVERRFGVPSIICPLPSGVTHPPGWLPLLASDTPAVLETAACLQKDGLSVVASLQAARRLNS